MAVFDKKIAAEYKAEVVTERSFDKLEDAVDNAKERYAKNIVSVWEIDGKYYVLPISKWFKAERLDFKQVVNVLEISKK